MGLIVIKGKQPLVTLDSGLTRHGAPKHELVIALADSYHFSMIEEQRHTEGCWKRRKVREWRSGKCRKRAGCNCGRG